MTKCHTQYCGLACHHAKWSWMSELLWQRAKPVILNWFWETCGKITVSYLINHLNYCVICIIYTYLLLPNSWSGVLLEKLTSLQLVKNFPTFYGTHRFITTFTSACHLSVS